MRELAAQSLWRGPLTRNLRDERANSDLSPQAGRGKGRAHMQLLCGYSGAPGQTLKNRIPMSRITTHCDARMRAVQSSRRRSRNTLPRSLLGKSATMMICFGIFGGGKKAAQCRLTEASVRLMPGLAAT
jgi:hypothetical protein